MERKAANATKTKHFLNPNQALVVCLSFCIFLFCGNGRKKIAKRKKERNVFGRYFEVFLKCCLALNWNN